MSIPKKSHNESNEAYAERLANLAVEQLQGITEETEIKNTILPIWESLLDAIPNENSQKRPAKKFREIIKQDFPDKQTATSGYYFTTEGKGKLERFQHIAFWYVTNNRERWEVVGDDARKRYFAGFSSSLETATEENTITEITANIPTETKPETTTELTLESMQIETLQLDADTQQKVQDALDYSGMSLADFIQKACTIYATTLTGKAKQFDSDLSEVKTQELLSAKYRTHPGRAREMVKRAIQAIKIHNSEMVSETGDRWHINQTAIQSLTGSKPQTVKEILADYQDDITSHNENYELTPYLNRKADKRKIEDVIDVAALVPNGIE
ncbi:hypothetical protein IQ231_16915 [Cuspidothrix issatschenkoi LEGE 03284]|uniref:hypothetical protein n=1 Tax=Cuspidothrix issatschenkoi TaxID=230752 RepID=UPI0018825F19|nr:hypothetical protein [Cuspidothrix issatschenkoi]MBE9233305.1 hypothetical protein [Cuspidothrix issatschenkoi LEGE 03284]